MEIAFLWFVFSIVAGVIASSKGRSGFGYFLLSIILSPLIGIILAAALPRLNVPTERETYDPADFKKCPMCAEMIRREAIKCRYCGSDIPAAPASPPSAAYGAGRALAEMLKGEGGVSRQDGQPRFGLLVVGVLLLITGLIIYGGTRQPSAPTSEATHPPVSSSPRSSGWGYIMSSRYDYKTDGERYAAVFSPPLRLTDANIRAAMHSLAIDAFRLSDFPSAVPARVTRGTTTALAVSGPDGNTYLFVPMKGRNELMGMGFWRE